MSTPARTSAIGKRSNLALLGLPVLSLLLHLVTPGASDFGFHRDELYYLANGRHLGFGYVDHPPLIGLVAALVQAVLGESLFAIRLVPALAGAALVGVVVETARTLGGGRFAQLLAGTTATLAPAFVGLFGFFSMNAFDLLFWAIVWMLVVRILAGGNARTWIWVGIACGVGLQNKISVLFLGFGLLMGIALGWRWELLRGRWPWVGAAIAITLFLPHLLWQAVHGWPTLEFMENARASKMLQLAPTDFLLEQVISMNPVALPVWLGGLLFLLLARAARPFRLLGWAFLAVLGLLIVLQGKAYYATPAFSILFAAGGVAWEAWSARRATGVLRAALLVLVVAGGALGLPMAKPVLPIESFVRYTEALGLESKSGERHEQGRLPQFFADRIGWPELARAVADVHASLPPEERAVARTFAGNSGRAGAIDLFGPELGLSPAISGHNSYHLWGPGDWTGEVLIVIGSSRERLLELFESVELGAVYTCDDCMPYESKKSIWIARIVKTSVEEFWALVKSFG